MRSARWWALAVLAAVAAPAVAATRSVEDFEAGGKPDRWAFSEGKEFPGAKGGFERSADAAHGGKAGGKLAFDFSGGGAYVAAILKLDGAPETAAVRVWVKKPRGNRLTFRYTDQTGQTLQKSFFVPDDRWFDALVTCDDWSGHWGGSNDGVVHGAPTQLALLVENSGARKGALLFDDVRLVEGKPGSVAGMETTEYVAARFAPTEGWQLTSDGPMGASKLEGNRLRLDFRQGARWIGLVPPDTSLIGTPREIRVRTRGGAAGCKLRVRMATHFMSFEREIGALPASGDAELTVKAPPGEGWTWFGGENDGKIHGPLRIVGLYVDRGDNTAENELELRDIVVSASCPPERACIVTADEREDGGRRRFVASVRSMAAAPMQATLNWTIRDWQGAVVARRASKLAVPGGAAPVEASVDVPDGRLFLEAQVSFEAANQFVPDAYAYYVAPLGRPEDTQREPRSPFGMGVYLNRYGGDPEGLKVMDQAARLAAEAGVKWTREDISWPRAEPRQGQYDWSFYDNLVATAKRHGISMYGLIAGWPGWTTAYSEQGIDDYCRFAKALVARYKGDVNHWEIWNEPNIFFWQGPKDMYAQLLKRAYAAIKEADPNAQVLGCSTAGIDEAFIKRTMSLGATFDALTIHPYRTVLDDKAFVRDLKSVADVVKRPDGTLREVWITEMGWATHVPHNTLGQDFQPHTPRQQACLIVRSYVDAVGSGVAPNISWYDFRNDGFDPINFEHNMGIMTRDFRPKPAYRAYGVMTGLLRGKRPAAEHPDFGPDVTAYRFADAQGGRPVLVLWSIEEDRQVSVPAATQATVTDVMGNARPAAPSGGKLTLKLQAGVPLYVALGE